MAWTDTLNAEPSRIPLGGGRADLLNWAYDPALVDNQPHRHTFFEACLVGERGSGEFRVRDVARPLTPGTLFIARPGVVHQITNTPGTRMELRWVCFSWVDDNPRSEAALLMAEFAKSDIVQADGQMVASVWGALQAVAEGPAIRGRRDQVTALATALILAIAQTLAVPASPESGVPGDEPTTRSLRMALRYIEDNLNRNLSIDEIANHACVSVRSLTRHFGQYIGTSPAQYVLASRLDRSKALLRHSQKPIKEIAAECGFSEVQYMTRQFTRRFGVPPGAYRNGDTPGEIVQNSGGLV